MSDMAAPLPLNYPHSAVPGRRFCFKRYSQVEKDELHLIEKSAAFLEKTASIAAFRYAKL